MLVVGGHLDGCVESHKGACDLAVRPSSSSYLSWIGSPREMRRAENAVESRRRCLAGDPQGSVEGEKGEKGQGWMDKVVVVFSLGQQ